MLASAESDLQQRPQWKKRITFAATDDSVDDDGESVLLGFGTLPINGESTVNITDNDVPSVTVRYEQASYTVGEGSSEHQGHPERRSGAERDDPDQQDQPGRGN